MTPIKGVTVIMAIETDKDKCKGLATKAGATWAVGDGVRREAGFSATPHDDAVSSSGRNDDVFGWVGEKGTRVATLPSKMRGFFAALRMTT